MSIEDRAKQQLFVHVKNYIDDGWSNARIKEFLSDDIKIEVFDSSNLKVHNFVFKSTIITDSFLNKARTLSSEINKDLEMKSTVD